MTTAACYVVFWPLPYALVLLCTLASSVCNETAVLMASFGASVGASCVATLNLPIYLWRVHDVRACSCIYQLSYAASWVLVRVAFRKHVLRQSDVSVGLLEMATVPSRLRGSQRYRDLAAHF